MKPAPRRWQVASSPPLPGLPPLLGQVLAARGFDRTTGSALLGGLAAFHDPLGLRGMGEAVVVLQSALRGRERIAIYGDYDADGVTACALLTRALRGAGADVLPYIPHRQTEGYGLHQAALEDLHARGVTCVVTVDCGTSSVGVAAGRPRGMRLVVTDHHLPLAPGGLAPALAPADALVNPKQPGCEYAFDGLAGAGVAWKLLAALEEAGVVPCGSAEAALGLAALGTIADMMPLRDENRLIVQRGLPRLADLPGLAALCRLGGAGSPPRAADVAFSIAPRINAAGRMEHARLALDLCLSDDPVQAEELARQLDEHNRRRQAAVARACAQAEERVRDLPEDTPAIVLGDPDWEMGIVGLVAGRLTERYARPSFVVCLDPEEAKGSARSVPGVHVVEALDAAASSLIRYGGHRLAAGFSLQAPDLEEFATAVSAGVAAQLDGRPPVRLVAIDGEISMAACCGEQAAATCDLLDRLEPCGQANASALLLLRDCTLLGVNSFGADRQHVSLWLGDGDPDGPKLEAVAFFKPALRSFLLEHGRGRRLDVCIGLERDRWQGETRVRARLRDLRFAAPAAVATANSCEAPTRIPEPAAAALETVPRRC